MIAQDAAGNRQWYEKRGKQLKDECKVKIQVAEPVPMQLRNAPTRSMKEWGYGAGYQHAHDFEDAVNTMDCLPESLRGKRWYFPTDRGVEKRIGERLEELRRRRTGGEENVG